MTRIGSNVGSDDTFTITGVIETGAYGIAVGFQRFGKNKYWCTWEYRTDTENDYYHGHYMIPDEATAWKDAVERSNISTLL